MTLQNQVAIVTGGAVRIGRDVSLALSEAGMRVCLHYGSSSEAALDTATTIREAGGDAITIQADLGRPHEAAATVVDAALQAFGQADVLINNAAIFEPGRLKDLTVEEWERHQAINLAAPVFLCQRFANQLAERCGAGGAIINIADWRALRPQPGHLAYTISKAGLVALTRILAQELAPHIRVNAVAPGAILPPSGAPQDHQRQMSRAIPLRRTGSPADLADAVLFLLRSEFITGEVLHVTGGQQLAAPQPSCD